MIKIFFAVPDTFGYIRNFSTMKLPSIVLSFSSKLLSTLTFFVICSSLFTKDVCADPVRWESIDAGIELSSVQSSQYVFFSADLILLRFNSNFFLPGVVEASDLGHKISSIEDLVTRTGAVAGINANFFDQNQDPLGLVISRGKIKHKVQATGSLLKGIFQSNNTKFNIVNRLEFYNSNIRDAFQAGPVLMQKGKLTQINKVSYEKRSGICIDDFNNLIIYASNSNLFGFSLQEIQEILKTLNCVDALNLDGGGSTQLFAERDQGLGGNIIIKGIDDIPVGLVLFKRITYQNSNKK